MRCDHARDDGAYVLGALSPVEREAFERHLAVCAPCRDAVAELAVLPGLLGRLDVATAEALAADGGVAQSAGVEPVAMGVAGRDDPGSARLARLLRAADDLRRRDRRRRRWRALAAGLAVACMAGLAGFGVAGATGPAPVAVGPSTAPDRPAALTAMEPVSAGAGRPITAEVGLTGTAAGTRVWMHCMYASTGRSYQPHTFRLVGYGRDGTAEQVASWRAAPGDELSIDGVVRYGRDELDRVELQGEDGTPLLVYRVA